MGHARLAHVCDDDFILWALFARSAYHIDQGSRNDFSVGKGFSDPCRYGRVVPLFNKGEAKGEPDTLFHYGELAVRATAVGRLTHIDDIKRQVVDVFGFFACQDEPRDTDEYLAPDIGARRVETAHPLEYFRHVASPR